MKNIRFNRKYKWQCTWMEIKLFSIPLSLPLTGFALTYIIPRSENVRALMGALSLMCLVVMIISIIETWNSKDPWKC